MCKCEREIALIEPEVNGVDVFVSGRNKGMGRGM